MTIWDFIYKAAWAVLGLLILLALGRLFYPQWQEYREYRRTQEELSHQIRVEKEMLNVLKQKQERFHNDPEFVRKLAHDLGLAGPDELIFKYMPGPAAPTNAPSP